MTLGRCRLSIFCSRDSPSLWIYLSRDYHCTDTLGCDLSAVILKRFRGGLVFKAHRLLYRSTLDSTVVNQKTK